MEKVWVNYYRKWKNKMFKLETVRRITRQGGSFGHKIFPTRPQGAFDKMFCFTRQAIYCLIYVKLFLFH